MPKWLKIIGHCSFSLFILLAVIALHMGYQQLTGNFHTVIAGELYRSAQPQPSEFANMAKNFNIRSVINLRDDISAKDLQEEKQAAEAAGITFYHFPMSSSKHIPFKQADNLMALMREVPKPLLLHCDHGANRTGFASAVYASGIAGMSELFAEFQLSYFYGHIPIKGIGRYKIYESWDAYEEKFGF